MSSLVGKLETDVEIKASADKFHEVMSCRPHHLTNTTPHKVMSCDMHQGQWGKPGSVISWNYMHDGVAEVAKEVIEEIDDKNNSTTFKVIEGHLLDKYKNIHTIVKVSPKSGGGSLVHWTMNYEKKSADVPEPNALLELAVDVTKDLDAHLVAQA